MMYEYLCEKCDERFEELVFKYDDYEPQLKCPKCGTLSDRIQSTYIFEFAQQRGCTSQIERKASMMKRMMRESDKRMRKEHTAPKLADS